jgi:hypothetical protein
LSSMPVFATSAAFLYISGRMVFLCVLRGCSLRALRLNALFSCTIARHR